jgi:hypothetical protein
LAMSDIGCENHLGSGAMGSWRYGRTKGFAFTAVLTFRVAPMPGAYVETLKCHCVRCPVRFLLLSCVKNESAELFLLSHALL